MNLWAIVPVKPLRRGKSRLAGVLSEADRFNLNRSLLSHTIATFHQIELIEQRLVVSRDTEALALARNLKARTLREDGSPELNVALARAVVLAKVYAVSRVLVIPADLPFMEPEDIQTMIALGEKNNVVIAPDRRRNGTNVLFLKPPDAIPFDYGAGSFERHCSFARAGGLSLEIYDVPSLALDLDYPEDLALIDGQLEFKLDIEPVEVEKRPSNRIIF